MKLVALKRISRGNQEINKGDVFDEYDRTNIRLLKGRGIAEDFVVEDDNPLLEMTVKELKSYAEENSIELESTKKAEILAEILAFEEKGGEDE